MSAPPRTPDRITELQQRQRVLQRIADDPAAISLAAPATVDERCIAPRLAVLAVVDERCIAPRLATPAAVDE